jgi:hypothetical protein
LAVVVPEVESRRGPALSTGRHIMAGQTAPRRWKRCVVAVAGVATLLVAGNFLVRFRFPPTVARPENRSQARIPNEELVRNFILNSSRDEKAVEFHTWGPHMTKGELQELGHEAGYTEFKEVNSEIFRGFAEELFTADAVIRVRFSSEEPAWDEVKREYRKDRNVEDVLFLVRNKQVTSLTGMLIASDDWKPIARKILASMYPGIKVPGH